MTIAEMIQEVIGEYDGRYQVTSAQALRYMNIVQEMCFAREKTALLEYSQFVSVVSDQLSYSMPTNPPCRRFVGVTKNDPDAILGINGTSTEMYEAETQIETDYNFVSYPHGRNLYEKIYIKPFDKAFEFAETPSEVADTYRMVYYRGAPAIRNTLDDANMLIPSEMHHSVVVQAMIKLVDNTLFGEKSPDEVIEPLLKPWDRYLDNLLNEGNRDDYISEGQPLC